MQMDVRLPVLVVTGAWNPAIFSVNWIARELLKKPEGEVVEVLQVLNSARPEMVVQYFGDLGLGCTQQRLEVYVNSTQDECLKNAEALTTNIIAILSHTPIEAVGINFTFRETHVQDAMEDALLTGERLEGEFDLLSRTATTQASLGDGVILNLQRRIDPNGFFCEFNFHNPGLNADNYRARIDGMLIKYKKRAIELVERFYKVTEIETVGHDRPALNNEGTE